QIYKTWSSRQDETILYTVYNECYRKENECKNTKKRQLEFKKNIKQGNTKQENNEQKNANQENIDQENTAQEDTVQEDKSSLELIKPTNLLYYRYIGIKEIVKELIELIEDIDEFL
ncbi:6977_t:CDS:2, partial [Dentiscutata heterogama]